MPKRKKQIRKGNILTTTGKKELEIAEEVEQVSKIPQEETCSGNCTDCACKQACICIEYDGQNWQCKVHDFTVKCLRCNCINAEIFIPGALEPIQNYRCRVCGIFYSINETTGEYM